MSPLNENRDRFESWVRHYLPEAKAELQRRKDAGDFIANEDSFIRNWAACLAGKPTMLGEDVPHPTLIALRRHIATGRARLALKHKQGEAA